MKLLVSACLLGFPCRYDGRAKPHEGVLSLLETHTLIPFCPGTGNPTPGGGTAGRPCHDRSGP